MKIILITFLGILFLTTSAESSKILDLKAFTMEVPVNWVYVKKQGIDSYVGAIAIDEKDTLYFDYGRFSNDLEESFNDGDYYVINNDSIFTPDSELNRRDTISEPVYKYFGRGGKNKLQELKKTTSYYKTIDGLKAKIVVPINPGTGKTGIFFENTRKVGKGMRLQINGNDLSLKNHKAFLKAMKTINFKD